MIHESPATLKQNLLSIISDMQSASHLFVKQPGKDFSRKRKVSFSDTVQFLLTMNENRSVGNGWNSGIFGRIWLLFLPFPNNVKNYCLIL